MTIASDSHTLNVALVQMAPSMLNREAGLARVADKVKAAASEGARLAVFGEALVPGYPFWIELTNGAKFNSDTQKQIHSLYAEQAVQIERDDLAVVCEAAKKNQCSVYLGIIERPANRTGHSLYASLVYIDQQGEIGSVHRKLMPTYEERLSWSIGDGHGLRVHSLPPFTVGGLNCWENWMPLARSALYAQGEDLHIAVWPGNLRNTEDLTRVIAKESRSFVISVSGLMRPQNFPAEISQLAHLQNLKTEYLADGGSCLAAPDGSWIIEPKVGEEGIYIAEIDHQMVRRERQNFDPFGHYSRPDVLKLSVNRERQSGVEFNDSTMNHSSSQEK